MILKHESGEQLKKQILEIISKYLDLDKYKVFFFGSRVDGKAGERSDIDLGIEGTEKIASEDFLNIKEEIENLPILYTVDVVDFKRVSDDFKYVAMKKIEIL